MSRRQSFVSILVLLQEAHSFADRCCWNIAAILRLCVATVYCKIYRIITMQQNVAFRCYWKDLVGTYRIRERPKEGFMFSFVVSWWHLFLPDRMSVHTVPCLETSLG